MYYFVEKKVGKEKNSIIQFSVPVSKSTTISITKNEENNITSDVSGTITEINVNEGDAVGAGDVDVAEAVLSAQGEGLPGRVQRVRQGAGRQPRPAQGQGTRGRAGARVG